MKGWILILICLLFMVIGFSIAKLTTKPVEAQLVLPDVSRQTDMIDSLKRHIKYDSAMIKTLYVKIDSLKNLKAINHKKLQNDINKIQGLTKFTRNAYLDSIYSADHK